MNFICDHPHVAFQTNLAQGTEFYRDPYPSHRVVWAAANCRLTYCYFQLSIVLPIVHGWRLTHRNPILYPGLRLTGLWYTLLAD